MVVGTLSQVTVKNYPIIPKHKPTQPQPNLGGVWLVLWYISDGEVQTLNGFESSQWGLFGGYTFSG